MTDGARYSLGSGGLSIRNSSRLRLRFRSRWSSSRIRGHGFAQCLEWATSGRDAVPCNLERYFVWGVQMSELCWKRILSAMGSHLLMSVLGVQVVFIAVMLTLLGSSPLDSVDSPAVRGLLGSVAGTLILWAFCAAWRDRRARNGDRSRAYGLGNLIDSLLRPRQEWWWATDDAGTIFSPAAHPGTPWLSL